MKTPRLSKKAMLASSVLAILLGASPVMAQNLPPEQTQGDVTYLTGGIGSDESQAMSQAARNWPLTLEFAVKDGTSNAFAANVKVRIEDAKGQSVLEATAKGPFLLARLAPGRYTVHAEFEGSTLTRKLTLKAGTPVREVLLWPQGAGQGRS
jgi:opacity protein-like surface antigen